ncbi:MerR family transcriptional regulator [Niallia circulans]|uniref:MerR family transcriptional regulator n=1 Tax=Niallia TaxID=2837506 RepID=UPI00077CB1FA|nr:MerR family transcriptional regulator [Niallia circulans]MCM2983572.1 MerR family transcriptional regulator [Niallia circulans]MED3841145.1 MerR family transcriptional regulator [Niallia circulans]MED4245722.1 MerR family transcriptional regulator [Niallia circulans]MED4247696.1 MerR family transcriptional regulator [Niallia circulans]QJX64200.1 MerR family transcriptional regulator [Niallia circulans]
MEEKLYSIGEVAKVANITIKALRHYDKIGLFKPAYVDPKTNYRYYRDTQLYRLDIIKLLISIGTPLGQIKEIQETDNLDFVAFLKKQEELISEKIASLLETQQSIRELREELQRQEYPFGEIVLMEKEDQAIIQTSVKNIGPQNILNPSYSNLKKATKEEFRNNGYGSIIPFKQYEKVEEITYSYLYTPVPLRKQLSSLSNEAERAVIPKGTYVCIKLKSNIFTEYFQTLQKLLHYVQEQNLTVTSDIYETFSVGLYHKKEEYISEFSVRVAECGSRGIMDDKMKG